MTERLPWFRCRPAALLGALAGMKPNEGYVYTVVLMRIYEDGGPVLETVETLSRRTGLKANQVAAALAWLLSIGKLQRLENGLLDSQSTHAELVFQKRQKDGAIVAGKVSASRRAEKSQQNQRKEATGVEGVFNDIDRDKEKEKKEHYVRGEAPAGGWDDDPEDSPEEKFWKAATQFQELGIARSRMAQLAKLHDGDFRALLVTLRAIEKAKAPGLYLGSIIKRRKEELAEGQFNAAAREGPSGEPEFVRSARREGCAVERRSQNRWWIAGATYDERGDCVGS